MQRTAIGQQTIRDAEVCAGMGQGGQEWCAPIETAHVSNKIEPIVQHLWSGHDPLWIVVVYYEWCV
jgi:hypothetical protein